MEVDFVSRDFNSLNVYFGVCIFMYIFFEYLGILIRFMLVS